MSGGWAIYGELVEADARWMQRMLQAQPLAAVGQLAASVAHEVGAPLTAITVAVEQLLKRECGVCAAGSHDLALVLQQTRRIAVLARRLVDLLNAERAMVAGGGAVRVATRARGNWVELCVSDTGPGISAEDLPKIFLPFFSRSGGTGLGLPLARQIVHAHGGTVDVDSRVGGGAKFTVRIPVATHE
ncbi:MAG: hypothetical protein FIB01_00250 [Gemmatimonadetes bacterium]|nr:hypothetical protein [Gemmatimonadota bacterium]